MFESLQRVFRESVAAFKAELDRREPEDELADLLSRMRDEWVEGRASVKELTETVRKTEAALAHEREELERCERRRGHAERIGDAETIRVAVEFAAKHRGRVDVLERKLDALRSERTLREREVAEMEAKYREADANRYRLLTELRRVTARDHAQQTASETARAFDDYERMAERIDREAGITDALEELEDRRPPKTQPAPDAPEIEERLRRLKNDLQF